MAVPDRGERHRVGFGAPVRTRVSLLVLLLVALVACGIQFGWALHLSLLTPYVQELGIPHAWASIIWLCGPLSGLFVQPLAGHMSDRCTSKFGRRRPFIVAGGSAIILSVLIIAHSADIGWLLGDRGDLKTRAVVPFVIGFWLFDVANNMTQGPCKALLADLTASTVPTSKLLSILTLLLFVITTYVSISAAQERYLNTIHEYTPFSEDRPEQSSHVEEAFLWELFGTFRLLPASVWVILLVTGLTWIGWFPFFLFDTDWLGREIYGGKPNEGQNYSNGVRMGAFGLMFNSVILGITSVFMEKLCRKWGAGFTWGLSNILMAICFISMLIISSIANNMNYGTDPPPNGIVITALIVFAVLGIPLAITYSVQYALISTRIEALGLGQGLSMGVLNLAIVIPQVVVSVGSGPLDQLFGGGNSPSFAVAAISAFVSGLVALLAIPRTRVEKSRTHQ